MTPRALRLIRGWTGAVAATSVAAVSHFMAGGSSPDPFQPENALVARQCLPRLTDRVLGRIAAAARAPGRENYGQSDSTQPQRAAHPRAEVCPRCY